MSAMGNLVIDIWEMLEEGRTPFYIAKVLDVPISFVYEAMEMNSETDSYSPFETINS